MVRLAASQENTDLIAFFTAWLNKERNQIYKTNALIPIFGFGPLTEVIETLLSELIQISDEELGKVLLPKVLKCLQKTPFPKTHKLTFSPHALLNMEKLASRKNSPTVIIISKILMLWLNQTILNNDDKDTAPQFATIQKILDGL